MTRGRKRKHSPTIPAHIDQKKLPTGCYWDDRDLVWYTLLGNPTTVKVRRKKIAGREAMLSDLHREMELLRNVNRNTLAWLMEQYHMSHVFKSKAESTQEAYETQHQIAINHPTKLGPLGNLEYSRLETHHFQKIVDTIADGGTPTKANSLMRYLKLVYSWGVRRGHVKTNPVKGVQEAAERKKRRLPDPETMVALIRLAWAGAQLKPHTEGSCPPYLWAIADIAYLCRLRGIEVVTLCEDAALPEGLRTNRRKGSRDNIVAWTPRLRAAFDWLIARRDCVWKAKHRPVPLRPKDRPIVISEDGGPLKKSSLDTAWQRLIQRAITRQVISENQRFGLHDLKRKGITDTAGTRADKQHASGHKSESMMDTYDLSVPVVQPSVLS